MPDVKSKWLRFIESYVPGQPHWFIKNTKGQVLGYFNKGKKEYWFCPYDGTDYSLECLCDIAEFMSKLNEGK